MDAQQLLILLLLLLGLLIPLSLAAATDAIARSEHPPRAASPDAGPSKILIGAHYFGGWFNPPAPQWPRRRLLLPLHGFSPLGTPTSNFFQFYPGRIPLLGNLTAAESTIAAEFRAADGALDFFDILHYDSGWDCGTANDTNLRWCLDSALSFALNSTNVWSGLRRLRFLITYSNDVDRDTNDNLTRAFVGTAGEARWMSLVNTWVSAMTHSRYLTINSRPIWKVLAPDIFVLQCGGNVSLANQRLAELRAAAVRHGLNPPLIGGGDQNPMIPSGAAVRPTPSSLPHPDGYMLYAKTVVNCTGCTIATLGAESVHGCQMRCNMTHGCRAVVITDTRAMGNLSCQLKSDIAPGVPDNNHDTYVLVEDVLDFDFTGTYNSAPPLCPGAPNLICPRYKNSWLQNATETGAKVFPYKECADFQGAARANHSSDRVPWLPNVIAGFDPRPWAEHDPSFSSPSPAEWEAVLRQVKAQCEDPSNHFGFPDTRLPSGVQPAFTIYAWNEYGEGGILAPTRSDGYMKLDTIKKVFAR